MSVSANQSAGLPVKFPFWKQNFFFRIFSKQTWSMPARPQCQPYKVVLAATVGSGLTLVACHSSETRGSCSNCPFCKVVSDFKISYWWDCCMMAISHQHPCYLNTVTTMMHLRTALSGGRSMIHEKQHLVGYLASFTPIQAQESFGLTDWNTRYTKLPLTLCRSSKSIVMPIGLVNSQRLTRTCAAT